MRTDFFLHSFRDNRGARSRLLRRVATVGAVLALLAQSKPAQAQTLRATIAESFQGGVAVDGWAVVSSPTEEIPGTFNIQLPRGARVRQAILYDVVQMGGAAPVPVGPAGLPRRVTLGSGATRFIRNLEGMPDTVNSTYGLWRNDVTAAVVAIVGGSAAGGLVQIPVTERGDAHWNHTLYPQYLQHQLIVTYSHDAAPVRSVVVYEGLLTNGNAVMNLPLPLPAANLCPANSPLGEPFAASIGIGWEYSQCEEESTVRVNGMVLTTTAGGSDDWDQVRDLLIPRPAGVPVTEFSERCVLGVGGENHATAALGTVGSFGGGDSAPGVAIGSPVSVESDRTNGVVAPRSDDELYDFRAFVPDGANTVSLSITGDGDEVLSSVVVQMLGRLAVGDADGDGHMDMTEGDCTIDTDRDGTPDYLDADSDNDCLPDRQETAAQRVVVLSPRGPDANCQLLGLGAACDVSRGVCSCRDSMDCAVATRPICDPVVRQCVPCGSDVACVALNPATPACILAGINAGACVQCLANNHCPAAAPVCDPMMQRCVDPDADMDRVPDRIERGGCVGNGPNCVMGDRDTDGDGIADWRDPDDDGDGILTSDELGAGGFASPLNTDAIVPMGEGTADNRPNYLDPDDDGDGIPTALERMLENNGGAVDADNVPAHLDRDSDGDFVPDSVEAGVDANDPANSDGVDRRDFLDLDSDNDCLRDSDPREAGAARIDARRPSAMSNDNCAPPTPVCNGASGQCIADRDSDMDGIPDLDERRIGTDPMNADTDRDGVPDGQEVGLGPLYMPRDTDADGTQDALDNDDDGDGVPTRDELGAGGAMMPRNTDSMVPMGEGTSDNLPDYLDPDDDGDGIATRLEVMIEGNIAGDGDGVPAYLDRDSDGDSVPDSVEVGPDPTMPTNSDGMAVNDRVDYLDSDSDNDCLADSDPREAGPARIDPRIPSMDANGNCPALTPLCNRSLGRCVMDGDADGDSIPDLVERRIGTDPNNPDTDMDGVPDGREVGAGPMFVPLDTDNDAVIDALDPDDDGDGIATRDELGADPNSPRNSDANVPMNEGMRDDLPDYRDPDDDGDGIPTRTEAMLEAMIPAGMGDMDGIPAYLDRDSDGDGVADRTEAGADPTMPANSDGMAMNDRPDFLDTDSDNDCIGDNDPREMGGARVDPRMPSAMANDNCREPTPVCRPSDGVCVPAMPTMDAGVADSGATDGAVTDARPMPSNDGAMDGGQDASNTMGGRVSGDGTCACRTQSPTAPTNTEHKTLWTMLLVATATMVGRRNKR